MRCGVVLCMYFCVVSSLLAQQNTTSDNTKSSENSVDKLENSGSDSFGYDISDKIRRAKSGVQVGIGINFTQNPNDNKLQVNASFALGFSYYLNKNFGIRAQGIFDNTQTSLFGGVGFDILYDFIQTELFGAGVFLGSSIGHGEQYGKSQYGGFLGQLHVGIGMIFDSGQSRLDGIARIPYNKIGGDAIYPGTTYILMYSYTF